MKELLDNGTLGTLQMVYSNQVGWFRPQHPWLFIQQESGGMLVEHNGSGMVSSKGPATLLSHGLRWKTHDMDAAEGSLPWCQTRHLPGFVRRASSTAVLGRLRQRS